MTPTTTSDLSIHTTEPATATRLREAFASFDRGDLAALQANIAVNAIWTNTGRSAIAGDYRGWDEIVGMLGTLMELSGGTFKTQVVSILANDTSAAAIYDATATVNGVTATNRFVLIDEYDADGRVCKTTTIAFDQATADSLMPG